MPRQDICQPQVMRALQKAGWTTDDQPGLIVDKGLDFYFYVDLVATRTIDQQTAYIEVKCFSRGVTQEVYQAIGQYLTYRTLLRRQAIQGDLVLALPADVYQQTPILKMMASEYQIEIILIDMIHEEILQWIKQP